MTSLRSWLDFATRSAKRLNRCGNWIVLSINGLDRRALDDEDLCRAEMRRLARRSLLWIVIGVPLPLIGIALVAAAFTLLAAP